MRARHAARWALWLVTLGLLCGVAAWRVNPAAPIQTNILALLPGHHANATLATATQRSRAAFSQQLLALVRGPDDANTRKAAGEARMALLAAGLTPSADGGQIDKALALYRRHGFALLDAAQATRFERDGAKALATAVAVALASPTGLVSLGHDPGGYVGRYVANLPRPYPEFLPDGPLLSAQRGDQRVFLLRMALPAAAFGAKGSVQAAQAVKAARRAVVEACGACRFEATGAALFAEAARHEAQHESIWLSVTSTLLIMILIAIVYRSLAPHVLGFLQLGASVVAGGAAVIAVFGSIHILTLVFGTTLLGIAIDYAFLYFSEYWFGHSPPEAVMRKIRAGLGIGLLTGVLAFACMALTGFPALSQMAVFSVAGLLEAALVVALIFPITLTRPPQVAAHPLVDWPARYMACASRPSRGRWLLPLIALLLALPGWAQLKTRDDVRALSHFPPQLLKVDQSIRTTLGRFPASGFFLTEAPTLGQALAREATLFGRIGKAVPQANPLGLSRYLPAPSAQKASLAAWQHVLGNSVALRQAFTQLGLPAALADHVQVGWQAANKTPLTASAVLAAVPAMQHFVIHTQSGVALMATVFGQHAIDNAALLAAATGVPGVRYIEPLARIDHTFARIRVRATWLVVIGYLLISAILVVRYGWREALRMLYPPLLALAVTLGALGWLGVPLNVFSVIALILILGLGRDYAVFLREVGARERSPALSVTLSALTTLIGFGLLALSATPALHAFGLTTGIGILASYLVAPLSLPPLRHDEVLPEEASA
ncbi:MAG TPA: MMPL family transporter [Rhodanobacteraceae bacterium]